MLIFHRSQIEEERQRATELESKLEASQTALQQTRERVGSLENDLQVRHLTTLNIGEKDFAFSSVIGVLLFIFLLKEIFR